MREIRSAVHEYRLQMREAIEAAIENNDFEAFVTAVTGTPLEDSITSEADFEQFVAAHELMSEGEFEAARAIMDELGIEKPGHGMHKGLGHGHRGGGHDEKHE